MQSKMLPHEKLSAAIQSRQSWITVREIFEENPWQNDKKHKFELETFRLYFFLSGEKCPTVLKILLRHSHLMGRHVSSSSFNDLVLQEIQRYFFDFSSLSLHGAYCFFEAMLRNNKRIMQDFLNCFTNPSYKLNFNLKFFMAYLEDARVDPKDAREGINFLLDQNYIDAPTKEKIESALQNRVLQYQNEMLLEQNRDLKKQVNTLSETMAAMQAQLNQQTTLLMQITKMLQPPVNQSEDVARLTMFSTK